MYSSQVCFPRVLKTLAFVPTFALLLHGCASGGGGAAPPPPPDTVSILTSTLPNGQVGTQYSATLAATGGTGPYTWSLTSGTLPSGLSLGSTGAITGTLTAAVTNTPLTFKVTDSSSPALTGSVNLTLTVTPKPPPISVSVSPTTASVLVATGTQAFTASAQNDSQDKGVTWALSGVGCSGATCGTLSNVTTTSVTYTAPAAVPSPASVTLTATSIADITKTFSATITVTANPIIVITIAPANPSVQTGIGTQNFTATLQNDSQDKGVTWALSGAGCSGATCGTLSNVTTTSVTYTAPANQPTPNTVTLTATSVADNTKSSTTTTTLTPPVSVSVAPTSASVAVSATQQFTPTVSNDAQNKGVTWSLSGTGCSGATCGAISSTGLYTAPSAVPSPATVTVTATSVSDPSRTATATVTVTAALVIVVTVSPTNQSVQTSGTQNFTASLQNDSQNKGVTWTVSGAGCTGAACGTLSNVATTSVTYTAPAAVPSPATVTLTATSVVDTTKTASATITVISGSITISISPKRAGLTVTQGLSVTATTNDGAGVSWTATGSGCSGTACGTFTNVTATTATYVAPSTASVYTIAATSVSSPGTSASVAVGVTDLAGVTTYHDNLSRDGTNTQEYALTTSNVTSSTFGKLFSCTIDSPAYAQPLWVANLSIGGGTHNVVFVASSRNTVYAFDADRSPCVTYWSASLLGSGETYLSYSDVGSGDIQTDIGIVGTPVMDLSTQTLYVVSKSKDSGTSCTPSSSCHQRLHALNLADHAEKFGGPYSLTSSITVPGNGDGSSNGLVPFDPLRENQRPGLALVNGVVYVTWASHGDNGPYHGWVIGFAAGNIGAGPSAVWNSTPNAVSGYPNSDGGIWMSGGAPAADASNNLYFLTGNGSFDANSSGSNYGDSTIKLSTSGSLHVTDYFTPANQDSLNSGDQDHGAGGAAILVDQPSGPVQHLLIGGGKSGTLFLVNRDNMGHYNGPTGPNNVVQSLSLGNGIFATGAFWNNFFYIAGVSGHLNQYTFNTGTGQFTSPATHSSSSSYGFPGSTPSVSSVGSSTNGIVWALDNSQYCTEQSPGCGPTVLHAYDASNVSTELWNSTQGSGNSAGNAVKFTVPTVANGKVYVPTRTELTVYGLLAN